MALAVTLSYAPHTPEPPQHAYLYLDDLGILEALYGGAAGGGKTDALLMGALRYAHIPGYSALLLRRTFGELGQADGLMHRAHEWLGLTDATYNTQDARWTFPSGARLQFGYLSNKFDRLRYQGGAYQFIGFDELTHFREDDYRYLLSRLRRPEDPTLDLSRVPLRMRSATNPGGPGHAWVKRRFIDRLPDPDDPEDTLDQARSRIFIPARLADNPHLDQDAYRRSLAGLPRVERAQLLAGDWEVDTGDKVYPPPGVRAALARGTDLDTLAAAGELPPPASYLRIGIDFGEYTHALLAYPLPHGGLYIAAGIELQATEISVSTNTILDLAHHLPAWPGRRPVRDPLTLIADIPYDPGGAGSALILTLGKLARLRHRTIKTTAVPFGSYKREAISYLTYLIENSEAIAAGELARDEVGYLAISPRAPELRRQLPEYRKNVPGSADYRRGTEDGDPIKEDDHGPDALVCAIADIARRHRDRGELDRLRTHARANAITNRIPRP